MEPDSSDQPPKWHHFSLAKLLIAVTLISLSFGIAGVPVTLYLVGWLAAMAIYFIVVQGFGTALAIFAFLTFIWLVMLAMQAVHFAFR